MNPKAQRQAAIRDELTRLACEADGELRPEAVVEAARPEDSPLHHSFTWDDSIAAHKWRLEQARALIRAVVVYEPNKRGALEARPVFVSLSTDRTRDGVGYRLLTTVLSDEDHRRQLLSDARAEMAAFRSKYQRLSELAAVFDAMAQTEADLFTTPTDSPTADTVSA